MGTPSFDPLARRQAKPPASRARSSPGDRSLARPSRPPSIDRATRGDDRRRRRAHAGNGNGTWARRHGKGRVFYTAMGHREDVWTNPLFQSILLGGLGWVFGDREAEVPPNIREATPEADVMPPA